MATAVQSECVSAQRVNAKDFSLIPAREDTELLRGYQGNKTNGIAPNPIAAQQDVAEEETTAPFDFGMMPNFEFQLISNPIVRPFLLHDSLTLRQ
jgi:hypothetical protein